MEGLAHKKGKVNLVSLKAKFLVTLLASIFLQIPFLFSGEIYRWTDNRETIHFTDDFSKIPGKYTDRTENLKIQEEKLEEGEKIEKLGERSDRVKDYLENIEKKIEIKKSLKKMISELEEELRLSEERLKRIDDYEREDYYYDMPFRNPRMGKWVPVVSPYYEEKRWLKTRIDALKADIERIQQRLSVLIRSL
jgi:DNA repair exonuclease SbcCD ATPase subunit